MTITAQEVNNLRKITGAGMMDCKKALQESDGDTDKAIELLRKKGQKIAAKRSDREASEGVVIAKTNSDTSQAFSLSLNCETDFVAKNDEFISYAKKFLDLAVENNVENVSQFQSLNMDGKTVEETLLNLTGKIGEKIEIGSLVKLEGPSVASYNHHNSKLSCLVSFNKKVSVDVAEDIAMQIAAMNPLALDESGISSDILDNEKRIIMEMLKEEGTDEAKLEMISTGKLRKFIKENTLLSQKFFKEDKKDVKTFLQGVDKELKPLEFRRISLS